MDTAKRLLALGFIFVGSIAAVFVIQYRVGETGTKPTVVDVRSAGRTATLSLTVPALPDGTQPSHLGIGAHQTLNLQVDDGGSVVGAISGSILYPPDLIQIDTMSFANSFCTLNTSINDNPKSGALSFSCQASQNKLTTQIGNVATISVTTRASGNANLQLSGDTDVQSAVPTHSVLASTQGLSLVIGNPDAQTLIVTSRTHPLSLACSLRSSAELAWLSPNPSVARFEYVWSDNAAAEPSNPTVSTSISLPTIPGATQFFRIRSLNSVSGKDVRGPITTYRVVSCP